MASGLKVLQLATSEEIFFKQQVEALESKGVTCDVLVVPKGDQVDGALSARRGPIPFLRFFPKVRRTMKEGSYDLVHANYGLTAPYGIFQKSLPVVLTLWGSDVIGFDGLVTRMFAGRCNVVTVRSAEMRDILSEEAIILPSGVDMELFHPIDRRTARNHVGWDTSSYYVLFPYSPDYKRKNYPLAESVVENVRSQIQFDVFLETISGIDHAKVPYYLNAANVVLITSNHEGSPNTVKEAMACNIPVVSTDVGDVSSRLEGVSPSGVGENEDELVEQLASVLRRDERSNGRNAVEHLSWDRIADQLIEIYESVL